MLNDFLHAATNSGIQVAFRLGIALIAPALLSLLAIRILMYLFATSTEKAKKQWFVEPAADAQPSLIARHLGNYEEPPRHKRL